MRPIGTRWRSAKFQNLISIFLYHFSILCRGTAIFFRRPAAFVFRHSADELMFGKTKNAVASTNRPSRIWYHGFLDATLCFCGPNKIILQHSASYGGRLVFFLAGPRKGEIGTDSEPTPELYLGRPELKRNFK